MTPDLREAVESLRQDLDRAAEMDERVGSASSRLMVNHDDLVTVLDALPALSVPEGWVAVPREPTEAMASAGGTAIFDSRAKNVDALAASAYRAMLSAIPSPEGVAE